MAASRTIKLEFNGEFRRVSFPNDEPTFSKLCQIVTDCFPSVYGFTLQYKDEEGDNVTMKTDDELLVAFTVAQSLSKPLKVKVMGKEVETGSEKEEGCRKKKKKMKKKKAEGAGAKKEEATKDDSSETTKRDKIRHAVERRVGPGMAAQQRAEKKKVTSVLIDLPSGGSLFFETEPDESVESVKARIESLTGISAEDQELALHPDLMQNSLPNSQLEPIAQVLPSPSADQGFVLGEICRNNCDLGFPSFAANIPGKLKGKWMYEVDLLSDGCMQIGWVDVNGMVEMKDMGQGVGDCHSSWSYDGWRKCKWHGGTYEDLRPAASGFSVNGSKLTSVGNGGNWKTGDVITATIDINDTGCKFDFHQMGYICMNFYKNGVKLGGENCFYFIINRDLRKGESFYSMVPALSLGANQKVKIRLKEARYPVDGFQLIGRTKAAEAVKGNEAGIDGSSEYSPLEVKNVSLLEKVCSGETGKEEEESKVKEESKEEEEAIAAADEAVALAEDVAKRVSEVETKVEEKEKVKEEEKVEGKENTKGEDELEEKENAKGEEDDEEGDKVKSEEDEEEDKVKSEEDDFIFVDEDSDFSVVIPE
eukprot:g4745.t1